MASADPSRDDIFTSAGTIQPGMFHPMTAFALREALSHTRRTGWESVRSPHVFMGLLSACDPQVRAWVGLIGADPQRLLGEFAELFRQPPMDPAAPLALNREFLSDSVIRILRFARERAQAAGHKSVTPLDLLICLFTTPNCVVAECFERVGVAAARLTKLAQMVEQKVDSR